VKERAGGRAIDDDDDERERKRERGRAHANHPARGSIEERERRARPTCVLRANRYQPTLAHRARESSPPTFGSRAGITWKLLASARYNACAVSNITNLLPPLSLAANFSSRTDICGRTTQHAPPPSVPPPLAGQCHVHASSSTQAAVLW